MQDITEALAVVRSLIGDTDGSKDADLTRFLEASKAVCPDGGVHYRPWISAAAYSLGMGGSLLLSNRYRDGLIKADGAEWIDPLKIRNSSLQGLLQTQKMMDAAIPKECIYPDAWKPDSISKCLGLDECPPDSTIGFAVGAFLI